MILPVVIRAIRLHDGDLRCEYSFQGIIIIIYLFVFGSNRESYDSGFSTLMFGESIVALMQLPVAFMLVAFTLELVRKEQKPSRLNIAISILFIISILTGVAAYYIIRQDNDIISENLRIFRNLGLNEEQLGYIDEIINYILKKESEGYNVYVISADASYYMASLGRNNYKFDLTLCGNLGKDGQKGLIADVSNLENAILLKDEEIMYQEPKEFDDYIKDNYKVIDKVNRMNVYVLDEN